MRLEKENGKPPSVPAKVCHQGPAALRRSVHADDVCRLRNGLLAQRDAQHRCRACRQHRRHLCREVWVQRGVYLVQQMEGRGEDARQRHRDHRRYQRPLPPGQLRHGYPRRRPGQLRAHGHRPRQQHQHARHAAPDLPQHLVHPLVHTAHAAPHALLPLVFQCFHSLLLRPRRRRRLRLRARRGVELVRRRRSLVEPTADGGELRVQRRTLSPELCRHRLQLRRCQQARRPRDDAAGGRRSSRTQRIDARRCCGAVRLRRRSRSIGVNLAEHRAVQSTLRRSQRRCRCVEPPLLRRKRAPACLHPLP
eukprot:Rhum_TRINITY_DN14027_c2_g1::Rhum_TRINITY_DN14027_c2_g1_i1::g.67964::m.67964